MRICTSLVEFLSCYLRSASIRSVAMMATSMTSSLRSFARQCPFMKRNNVAVPQSTAALEALASKCPITHRALAHTSAPLNSATNAAERVPEREAAPVQFLSPEEEEILKGVCRQSCICCICDYIYVIFK